VPREKIETDDKDFTVELTWLRDGEYVQVAVLATDGVERLLAILAKAGLKLVDAQTGKEPESERLAGVGFNGYHATLTQRSQLNRVIRVGRASRDQAFGRDE